MLDSDKILAQAAAPGVDGRIASAFPRSGRQARGEPGRRHPDGSNAAQYAGGP